MAAKRQRAKRARAAAIEIEKARVVVQFRPEFRIPYEDGAEASVERLNAGPWRRLAEQFPGIRLRRLIRATKPDEINRLIERARQVDPSYEPGHFFGYFVVETDRSLDLRGLLKELLSWPSVKAAYLDIPVPDPLVNAADDPRSPNQGYLDPSPDGIDAEYAWGFTGGDGAGQQVIDLERGWTFNHEDLNAHGATLLHGTLLDSSRAHGTAVLGELCAVDNTVGCVGIVPNVDEVDAVSYNGSTRVDAIFAALGQMAFGSVLLLEAQVTVDGASLLGPIEAFDAEFDAIRLATALGVIVVEAGGNGTNNGSTPPLAMDTFVDPMGRQIFNPGSADFRDSGAIIVTAATSTAPHTRMTWAPHGQRIDCYAWGENVNTCTSSSAGATTLYQTGFSGTSSASPIVTGAVLAIQGMVQAQQGFRFGPRQMRDIIRDPANGTPAAAGGDDDHPADAEPARHHRRQRAGSRAGPVPARLRRRYRPAAQRADLGEPRHHPDAGPDQQPAERVRRRQRHRERFDPRLVGADGPGQLPLRARAQPGRRGRGQRDGDRVSGRRSRRWCRPTCGTWSGPPCFPACRPEKC